MNGKTVAVVGVTGAVGREMVATLERRDFPIAGLRLMASERSAGTVVETAWGSVEIEELGTADPSGVDIALFSAGGAISRDFTPRFVEQGAVVVDNSSVWRMDPHVPLVVVGVNDDAAHRHRGIVANPNCTVMVLMMAVAPLHGAAWLRAMSAASYQSVSGSGQKGMTELSSQVGPLGADLEALQRGDWSDPGGEVYARPIGWNVVPLAGELGEGGYTDEEWKLVNESRKILEAP
ncbi:MAG: aspartate-semialdehyde dehydrogenase, partial [Acidimicrobiia bacterium]